MSQTTLTTFFNSRKRPATEEIVSSKNKIAHLERTSETVNRIIRKKTIVTSIQCSDKAKQVSLCNVTKCDEKNVDNQQSSSKETSIESKISSAFTKKTNVTNIAKNQESVRGEHVNVARKELSLGDIRKKLAGSSRLAELKASADRISKGIQQLREASDKRNLKEFRFIDVDIPVSPSKRTSIRHELSPKNDSESASVQQIPFISPRKVFVSPVKSPSKIPAYIKHASLASTSSGLPLPHHYRFLAELFRGMETVVALLFNRNEKITFSKLKPSIQEMLKRNFSEKHLAQIKQLVPDFYNFEIQKTKNFSTSVHKGVYELVISPNFPGDIKMMNPSVLLERRRYFYDTLLQLVKKHHAQYLLTLDPPIEIPDNKIVRWHPEFELEKLPEVESAKLPEMPNTEKFSSAQDVLAKARELFKCNTKMERALERLAQAKSRGLTDKEKAVTGYNGSNDATSSSNSSNTTQTSQQPSNNIAILNPALRNLPTALLEKVKAKQAAKALEAMTRSSEHEQKYAIYSRLPDLARTLRNIFVTERKNVLALNIVVSKLDSSFKSNVAASDLERDIKLLTEEVPNWIKLHEVRGAIYLKLDKTADLKNVISKLEAVAAKYKND